MQRDTQNTAAVSEKERAVFEAVFRLLGEGREFHELKVADIAAEAGIGKGTVYEYFPSKEDILPRAIVYRLEKGFEAADRLLENDAEYPALIGDLLDGAAKVFTHASTGAGALITAMLRQGPQKAQGKSKVFALWCAGKMTELCEKLAERGKAAGAVRSGIEPEFLRFAFSAAVSAYVQYVGCNASGCSDRKTREYATCMFLAAVG